MIYVYKKKLSYSSTALRPENAVQTFVVDNRYIYVIGIAIGCCAQSVLESSVRKGIISILLEYTEGEYFSSKLSQLNKC